MVFIAYSHHNRASTITRGIYQETMAMSQSSVATARILRCLLHTRLTQQPNTIRVARLHCLLPPRPAGVTVYATKLRHDTLPHRHYAKKGVERDVCVPVYSIIMYNDLECVCRVCGFNKLMYMSYTLLPAPPLFSSPMHLFHVQSRVSSND